MNHPNRSSSNRAVDQDGSKSESLTARAKASALELVKNSLLRPVPHSATCSLTLLGGVSSKGGSASSSTNPSGQNSFSESYSLSKSSLTHEQHDWSQRRELEFIRPQKMNGSGTSERPVLEDLVTIPADSPQAFSQLSSYIALEGQFDQSLYIFDRFGLKDDELDTLPPSKLESSWGRMFRQPNNAYLDGTAVVALLSDPAFSPGDETDDLLPFQNGNIMQQDEETPQSRSPFDSADFFSMSPRRNMNNIASEAVLPTALDKSLHEAFVSKLKPSDPKMEDSNSGFWLDYLRGYQDEVWGYVLPSLSKAHQNRKATEGGNESTAKDQTIVKRLAMILRHIGHTIQR